MATLHAVGAFIVGLTILVASISVLFVLAGLWQVWMVGSSSINMILTTGGFSILTVRMAWPLFVYWADLIQTAGESEDDE